MSEYQVVQVIMDGVGIPVDVPLEDSVILACWCAMIARGIKWSDPLAEIDRWRVLDTDGNIVHPHDLVSGLKGYTLYMTPKSKHINLVELYGVYP